MKLNEIEGYLDICGPGNINKLIAKGTITINRVPNDIDLT